MLIATAMVMPASAHDGTGVQRGFLSGVMHPLLGMDHLLAMVAVGVWGAFLGRPLIAPCRSYFLLSNATVSVAGDPAQLIRQRRMSARVTSAMQIAPKAGSMSRLQPLYRNFRVHGCRRFLPRMR